MAKRLSKVCVTSNVSLESWHGIELSDIFLYPEKVQIISAVVDEGSLYIIYIYDDNDFIPQ